MEIDPDDLTNEPDIKEVIRRISTDFGEDVSHVMQIYNQVDEKGKELLLTDLKNHYKKTGDWAKRDFEFALKYVKDTFRDAFGISEKRIDKMFKANSARKIKRYGWTVAVAFFLSCLSFIAVIIILTLLY